MLADALAPAIEIADSRIHRWQISLVDTIADNASSGMFVVGAQRRPFEAIDASVGHAKSHPEVRRRKGLTRKWRCVPWQSLYLCAMARAEDGGSLAGRSCAAMLF